MSWLNAAARRRYGIKPRPVRRSNPGQAWRPPPKELPVAKCRECQAEIVWITTAKSGKKVPLDDNLGQHSGPIFDEEGNYHRNGGYGRTSHFNTCPARSGDSQKPVGTPQDAGRQRQWELVCRAAAQTWSLNELQQITSDLSRLVGLMRSSGADPSAVEQTRKIVQGIARRGWS